MAGESSRRQSRGKQPKSYELSKAYSFLEEEGESASSGAESPGAEDSQEDGDDFMPDAEEGLEDDFDEDVAESSGSDDEYPDSELGTRETPELNIIEINSNYDLTPSGPSRTKEQRSRTTAEVKGQSSIHISRGGGASAKAVSDSTLRTRGIADFTKAGGQEVRLKDLFGPKKEDFKALFETRDHWVDQETLPLRKPGSLRRSFFENLEGREKEIRSTREWYTNIGRGIFTEAQTSETLTEETANPYMANDGQESLNVLLGPIDSPQVYSLKKRSYMNVAEPFAEKKNRRGWLFNLGSRIQDAQWATQEENHVQYLAVAVEQKSMADNQPKPLENPAAPAFTAAKPFPASILIWAFASGPGGELDSSKEPQLQLVICTDWGAPKQFRWCPVDTSNRSVAIETEGNVHIGLLAGIWSDGRLRILDISCPNPNTTPSNTHYLYISKAAFDISFPQTVPSCLRWLSGTTLAVGTAIGALAVWTLSQPGTFAAPNITNHFNKPWFYEQISDTYILTLSSGWPSQPQLISVTTADGFAILYDIRTPNADTTTSIRGRTLSITQDWHEHTQSFIAPDEHYTLKHNPIRRYYHNLYSMRAESSITRCAASPVHPGILIGGADGRVEASNPIGRITNYKIIPWQQTWFAHDWRGPIKKPPPSPLNEDIEMNEGGPVRETMPPDDLNQPSDNAPLDVLDKPLSRITQGHTAYQPGIVANAVTLKKPVNPELGKGIAVYEEKAAITALAWNPNLKFGTWAVAGMGDGLLRVEDVGV
ncbi:hypothetical protein GQ44DRAFT_831206 [Phaeosphaeriaceae sp. PMI808]|nr:hypothetical protein GQ44DRAFT_831206 [Phaeosphaeriaceae sp. PMI808]